MAYTVGFVCDIGIGPDLGGRQRNEDNYLVCLNGAVRFSDKDGRDQVLAQEGDGALLAVCDGMGGHDDGDIASATAVQVLAKLYQPGPPLRAARILLDYLGDSHRQLHRATSAEGPVTMGTTITAAWLLNGTVAWAQVGDSRLYLFRNDRLFQLTADQTRNEFARRDGRPLHPDGTHLAQNFIYGSRGLGDDPNLRLDHGLDSGAEVLHAGDRLLLCTDGLTADVPEETIRMILAGHPDPQDAAQTLYDYAVHAGSQDNITTLVVAVDAVSEHPGGGWLDESADDTFHF